jgi:hypothetical protein
MQGYLGFVEDDLICLNLNIPRSTDPDDSLPPHFDLSGLPGTDEEFFGPFFDGNLPYSRASNCRQV